MDFSESGASLDLSLENFFDSQQDDIFLANVNTKINSSAWDNYALNESLAEINQFGIKKMNLNAD